MAVYPRNGPASRAVALDLVLRTFMNSADFQVSNPKIWENISKIVPGTTPQQCALRWEELLLTTNSAIAGDLSGLTATGRPISSHGKRHVTKLVRTVLNQLPPAPSTTKMSSKEISVGLYSSQDSLRSQSATVNDQIKEDGLKRSLSETIRGHTNLQGDWKRGNQSGQVESSQQEQMRRSLSYQGDQIRRSLNKQGDQNRGTFVATFCQNILNRPRDLAVQGEFTSDTNKEKEEQVRPSSSSDVHKEEVAESDTKKTPVTSPNMIIHVCDDTKKLKKDFVCPRDILIREMHYFAEYLSSEAQLWDEVDISVHCDIPVFDWLMRYTKRGMLSDPFGEELEEPLPLPTLEPSNVVSILISSDFLKMDRLVEECLDYCHDHLCEVVASPCNMGCINSKLLARLGAKFSPLEVEEMVDRKDKIKSKLFIYQLEQLFKPSYSSQQCPHNAATLYMCKHCNRLLTTAQERILPCTLQRFLIDIRGNMIYSHERKSSWNINAYIQLLQQHEGLTPRDIYWRLWGRVNVLKCDQCHHSFQCCDLVSCAYHPSPLTVLVSDGDRKSPCHACCNQKVSSFSVLPLTQNGCSLKEHSISTDTSSGQSEIYSILLKLKDVICTFEFNQSSDHYTDSSGLSRQSSFTHPRIKDSIPRTKDSMLISLLQSEHNKSRYALPQSKGNATIQTDLSNENVASVSSTNSTATSTTSSTAPSFSSYTKQQSQDLMQGEASELEEDEGASTSAKAHQQHAPSAQGSSKTIMKRKGNLKQQRHFKHDSKGLPQPGNWIWNSKKSRRWNQDMQRESDERRQQQLMVQLSQVGTDGIGVNTSRSGKIKETTHAGGIFSRLEAQFRAQQAAKAMAIQTTQTRTYGSTRRRI